MPKDSRHEELAQQARFVFKGTVQKLKAATMRDVKVDARTAIVRVDEIIHASEALSNYAGKNITVQLGGRKKVSKGQQAVFYTNAWLFGERGRKGSGGSRDGCCRSRSGIGAKRYKNPIR